MSTSNAWVPVEAGLRELRRFSTGNLTIRRAAPALITPVDGPPVLAPLVLIRPQPQIADMIRLHRPEVDGDGEARYHWRFFLHPTDTSWAALKVEFRAPVRCTFTLQFDIARHLALLHLIVQQGSLTICTDVSQPLTTGLALQGIPVEGLAPILAAQRVIDCVRQLIPPRRKVRRR